MVKLASSHMKFYFIFDFRVHSWDKMWIHYCWQMYKLASSLIVNFSFSDWFRHWQIVGLPLVAGEEPHFTHLFFIGIVVMSKWKCVYKDPDKSFYVKWYFHLHSKKCGCGLHLWGPVKVFRQREWHDSYRFEEQWFWGHCNVWSKCERPGKE